jgi:hypothetical protein
MLRLRGRRGRKIVRLDIMFEAWKERKERLSVVPASEAGTSRLFTDPIQWLEDSR